MMVRPERPRPGGPGAARTRRNDSPTGTGLAVTLALALLAGATACGRAGSGAEAWTDAERGLAHRPPAVRSLAVRVAGATATTAEVTICLAPDPRLKSALMLDGERGPFALEASQADCPPGSRAFSGTAPLDARELVSRQQAFDRLARRVPHPLEVPTFRGREKTGAIPLARLDLGAIAAGQVVVMNGIWATPDEVQPARSLLVNDTAVVQDPARTSNPCAQSGTSLGKWTFGYLMKQIAGSTDAPTMTRNWLASWETTQTVNGLAVQPRALIRRTIIDPWQQASGSGNPLDLAKAPFRLLAIVNRIDLADNLAYGSGSGGELRFVFGALAAPPACTPLSFTVIFEFAVPRAGCKSLRDWARAWVDLGNLVPGSAAYESALEALTEEVVPSGAGPGKPNGSNLAQLRTNEIALADLQATPGQQFWEMREFHLDKLGGLAQTTVRRTPRPDVNGTATLSAWVDANAAAILSGQYEVPTQHPGTTPFEGGDALTEPTTFWAGTAATPIADAQARHLFSLNTCSGCHARETKTPFTHVSPTAPLGLPAPLSGFLTGITVDDPVSGVTRTFADLDARRTILADIANNPCVFQVFRQPPAMAH